MDEKEDKTAHTTNEEKGYVVGYSKDRDDDLIPFAWKHPLQAGDQKNVSKVFRNIIQQEQARANLVPVQSDND